MIGEHSREFEVVVGAGTLIGPGVTMPHRWTEGGVSVRCEFTGAHLLHLAAAGCVLNDVYREAETLGCPVDGVRVTADGGFDTDSWTSTGITYRVQVDTSASAGDVEVLLDRVDQVAEIPMAIRAGADVARG